jgi:DNA-binding winged helix-turn-helix (wHTH) protein/tetratricopeptide (TPR) repeat protein
MKDGITYEFADFRLVPDEDLLLRNGQPVPLPPKAFATLALLISRHGHLVKKAELIEAVWGDAFVEEAVVSKCVWTIRSALGEDSKTQHFIQTVPKRGYKFVAEVTELVDGVPIRAKTSVNRYGEAAIDRGSLTDGPEPTQEASGTDVPATRKSLPAYIAFAVIALTVVGIVAAYMASVGAATAGTGGRIAVLPLKPIDAANRSDIYEMGVADSLIIRLNSITGLVTRPLSATRKYDALDQDPLAAGREQKVDHVVASNYQIADGKFRLTAQLINVASGKVEESYKVETDGGNVFAIQDAVANEIAKKIAARFGRAPVGTAIKRGTNNEEAYNLYLQGRNLTMQRHHKKAIEHFEQAIKIDPNYALAYARMAYATYGSNASEDVSSGAEKAKELVKKALELDPGLAEAFVTRGYISLAYEWDFAAAERDLLRAIELEPNNDTAHWLYGLLLANRGLFEDGLREVDTALAIDPGAVVYMFHRGRILYYARRYDEAVTQYQQAIDLDDRFTHPYAWMSRLYETKGDHATAYQFFLKREERSPRKDRLESYRRIYETSGWGGLRRESADTGWGLFDLARYYALRGEKEAAFETLNRSAEKRDWQMTTVKVEPAFDSLRNDPRFAELVKRVHR